MDTYYQSRREHGIVVSMACTRPEETCFCTSFGIDPTRPEGDVSCWMDEENLYLSVLTEKGQQFVDLAAGLLEEGGDEAVASQQEATSALMKKLPLASFSTQSYGGDVLLKVFDSPSGPSFQKAAWAAVPVPLFVPPASVMTSGTSTPETELLASAAGIPACIPISPKWPTEIPRLTQLERFRQRFMHKLVYFPANNDGEYGCVGCGRCLAKCPISMNIVKVAKTLEGDTK